MAAQTRSRITGLAFLILLGLTTCGTIRLATLPDDVFMGNVMVDDTFYYLLPAENAVVGKGFSFDKDSRSNGVQPLWAITTTLLRTVVPERMLFPRAVVMLSGLMWIAAGAVLFRALRRYSEGVAFFSAAGWLVIGLVTHVSVMGMENGLHALLFALLIAWGSRHLPPRCEEKTTPDASYVILGILLSLFALTRVDSTPLVFVAGAMVGLGLIRPFGRPAMGLNWRGLFRMAIPLGLLGGGWLVFSKLYFGSLMPVSGKVKLFYEHTWGGARSLPGGIPGTLREHAQFLLETTGRAIMLPVGEALRKTVGAVVSDQSLLSVWLIALGLGLLLAVVRGIGARPRLRSVNSWQVWIGGLAIFVAFRFVMLSLTLPHFTRYCTWYFAPELMTICVLSGLSLVGLARTIGWIIGAPLRSKPVRLWSSHVILAGVGAILFVGHTDRLWKPQVDPHRINCFREAGLWMNRRLPAGQRIGSYSAGFAGYFAPNHQVFNLDGLINTERYLQEYLSKGREVEFVREKGIRYLADYAPLSGLRDGHWGIWPTANMRLIRWWPMCPDGNDPLRYCIWELPPPGTTCDVLDPAQSCCNRLSQIEYAAEVLKRFQVVDESGLEQAIAQPEAAGKRVFCSMVASPSMQLRHILVTDSQAASLGLQPECLDITEPRNVVFGGAVRLLGFDIPERVVQRGRRLVITRYWQLVAAKRDCAQVSFECWINPARPRDREVVPTTAQLIHETRGCHNTHPVESWKEGEIVVETYGIPVPRGLKRGVYPVMQTLRDPHEGWLLPDVPGASDQSPGYLLANIEVK